MPVKATFHLKGGDLTMTFREQMTYKMIRPANHTALLLLEAVEDMNEEMKSWLEYTMYHGRGKSIPRVKISVSEFDDQGNALEEFCCKECFGTRWFTKKDRLREIELEYSVKEMV